jgi:hypothetical protein
MNFQEAIALDLLKFRARNVLLWEEQSLALKAASEIIYVKLVESNDDIRNLMEKDMGSEYLIPSASGLNQIWMLSAGYSIECLMKAIIIVTTTKPLITPENKFNMDIFGNSSRSHDLHYLLQRKIDSPYKPVLSLEQNAFLLKMTAYTTWRGKYPVPKEPMDQLRYLGPDNEQMYVDLGPARLSNNKDRTSFMAIFDLLYTKLQEAKENKV